jgi:uncharacterized membrane protein (UPF0127 family)
MMKVIHTDSGKVLGEQVKLADGMLARMKGLMFIDKMEGFDGLILDPCNSIHNFFVRFPIDVIFMDRKNKVVKVIKEFRPWAISRIYFSASKTLELPAGTIDFEIKKGDQLEVIRV